MTMQRDIALQVGKAREWLRVCRDLRWAADARLRAGGEFHEVGQKRIALRAAEARCQDAFEDLKGWQRLARRIK